MTTRGCTCLVIAFALALPSPSSGDTLLSTDPPQTYLAIEGPISVRGRAPLSLDDLPPGRYSVVTSGDGVAQGRSHFLRSDIGVSSGDETGLESFLYPPGWRHLGYERWRGLTFLGAGVASGILAARAHADVRDAEDDLDRASRAYERAVVEADILDARELVTEAATATQDYEEVRQLWGIYFGTAWAGAALESWLFSPSATMTSRDEGEYVLAVPRAGRAKLTAMSLLIPGSGQRYVGRTTRGTFFSFAVALLGAQAIESHDDFLAASRKQSAAQARYDRATSPEGIRATLAELERAADEADDEDVTRRAFFVAALAVHALNVIDAFFLGGESGSDQSNNPRLSVVSDDDAIGARFDWSFR